VNATLQLTACKELNLARNREIGIALLSRSLKASSVQTIIVLTAKTLLLLVHPTPFPFPQLLLILRSASDHIHLALFLAITSAILRTQLKQAVKLLQDAYLVQIIKYVHLTAVHALHMIP
jgi:hypothetical protein